MIIVMNWRALQRHDVVAQRFLEGGRHKVIAWTTPVKYGKVDLEPEKVKEEWHNNHAKHSCSEMVPKLLKSQPTFHIEEIPQINGHGRTNGDKRENTDIFRRNDAR